MSDAHWRGLSYLSALRPDPGWEVDWAILTTYSLDLVPLVAAMLALNGVDNDRGSGSRIDFANAYEALRGKLCVLVQAGRVAYPRRKLPILTILDRFIKEVHTDEAEGSWHPKIALVRYHSEGDEKQIEWRLWISSRNLTRDLSWDAGLLLVGQPDEGHQPIPGIDQLIMELITLSDLVDLDSESIPDQLKSLHWRGPENVELESVRLLTANSTARGLPEAPAGVTKLIVVSPFIDGTTIKRLGQWGGVETERVLLSTLPELVKLSGQATRPLAAFRTLLSLDTPEFDEILPYQVVSAATAAASDGQEVSEDEEIEARGLHAKLIYAEHRAGRTLWLGSANVTTRGWVGPNTEVVAQLRIDQTLAQGLEAMIELARPVNLLDLPQPEPDPPEEMWLEEARKQVVARWQVIQQRLPAGPRLVADTQLPHPDRPDIALSVGLLAGDLIAWPRNQHQLQLPPISKAQETELLQVKLNLGDYECIWLQRAPLSPPPDIERDRYAIAEHLDSQSFLAWLRSLLGAGDVGYGGGDWDAVVNSSRRPVWKGEDWWTPTLEEILKAWSRDPQRLQMIDHRVNNYLELMQKRSDMQAEEQEVLQRFYQTWQVLRQVFVAENHDQT